MRAAPPDGLWSTFKGSLWVVAETLAVYADESGTHDKTGQQPGSDVAGVVGYIGWKSEWGALSDHWGRSIGMRGLADFHMKSFMRGMDDEYRGWSLLKRSALRKELLRHLRNHSIGGEGGLVVVPDYDAIMPASFKEAYRTPYGLCFRLFIDMMRKRIEQIPGIGPDDQATFLFDENQQFKDEVPAAYYAIKENRDTKNRMGEMGFGERKKNPPLQAADMVAWICRDSISRMQTGNDMRRWARNGLQDLHMGYFDKDNLPDAVKALTASVRGRRYRNGLW